MTRDTAGTTGTRRDPFLKDFYHDMNEHAGAEYRRVAGRYVVELDTTPGGYWITVWEAVQHAGRYVLPETGGNRYEWDAIGRETFTDDERNDAEPVARSRFAELTGKKAVRWFCQTNPYEGPRSTWTERQQSEGTHE